jgi:hypothetical protein
MISFKTINIFEAPKWLRRLSESAGLVLSLSWLVYAAYVSVSNHLGWPPYDEQIDIVSVAVLTFAAGWACVRICFGLGKHLHGQMISSKQT